MKAFRAISTVALLALSVLPAIAQEKQSPSAPNGATPGPKPQMVIESLTHDFGEVNAGTPLRYAFKVKNAGNADLLINSVTPG